MSSAPRRVTICIPHWQVGRFMRVCLRSIRKHSGKYDLEVLVVDNGSRDESLDYLRSLDWIRLIERPHESPDNWPMNVFTAWDRGIREATGELFLCMHSDVFVLRDDWLDPLLREIDAGRNRAASGAWKLELENPLYQLQKRAVGYATARIKQLFGRRKRVSWRQGHYPRDFCALYRRKVILDGNMTFRPIHGQGGGYSIAKQLWDAGYEVGMVPVREMAACVVHVAHGTAAVRPEKRLNHRRSQRKVEEKVGSLFDEPWFQEIENDEALDRPAGNKV